MMVAKKHTGSVLLANNSTERCSIENEYSKSISLEHRKKFAQFFTPFPIADLIAKWILGNENLKTVLEPAFGLGMFSRAILNYKKDVEIKGFEVDETIFEYAKQHFDDASTINLLLEDYMYNDWENKYDGIMCNPPYFKFHDYDNKNILKEIETHLKCKLNGFTNLYTLFLLKSIHQLNPNGRCAYIIPSEFLNSDYGKLVKNYLIKSKVLRHIIVIDFEENVFDDALTTASIILCANDNLTERVQFSNIQSLEDLSKIDDIIANYSSFSVTEERNNAQTYNFSELNPEIKWKAYYQKQNSIKFKNLVPFSTYAKVVRGIATGSNEYFTFSLSKAKEYAIEERYLLPCICSAKDAKTAFFTTQDFEELKQNDKSIFLFNALNSTEATGTDNSINFYIQKGEKEEINKRFLTASRNPWYSLENRKPAPIWVSVFNRTGLRFIRNEANISNLTSYHCIYPKSKDLFSELNIDLLFAYLLTDTAKQIFEDNSRQYGNGLQKFEPNDLNKAMMLDLGLLDKQTQETILYFYGIYRILIFENQNGNEIIAKIDKILITNYSEKPITTNIG
jgi:adenine-specific DNA-methyltransferase